MLTNRFARLLLALLLLLIPHLGHSYWYSEHPTLTELVANMRSDNERGNATRAERVILYRLRFGICDEEETVALLSKVGRESEDSQQREVAQRILTTWRNARKSNVPRVRRAVEELRAGLDENYTLEPIEDFLGALLGEDTAESREARRLLEAALRSDNYQQRQYATRILYNSTRSQRYPNAKAWDAMLDNMVEGLGHDEIRGDFGRFGNAECWYSALSHLRSDRPVARLEKALNAHDGQKRFLAACLLAKYQAGTVQPQVTTELRKHMQPDNRRRNASAAVKCLRILGKENLERTLKNRPCQNWQEAALLLILATEMELPWRPDEKFVAEWAKRAAPDAPGDYWFDGYRICRPALFLWPISPDDAKKWGLSETIVMALEATKKMDKTSERRVWLEYHLPCSCAHFPRRDDPTWALKYDVEWLLMYNRFDGKDELFPKTE